MQVKVSILLPVHILNFVLLLVLKIPGPELFLSKHKYNFYPVYMHLNNFVGVFFTLRKKTVWALEHFGIPNSSVKSVVNFHLLKLPILCESFAYKYWSCVSSENHFEIHCFTLILLMKYVAFICIYKIYVNLKLNQCIYADNFTLVKFCNLDENSLLRRWISKELYASFFPKTS